jgi:hypothetical protein
MRRAHSIVRLGTAGVLALAVVFAAVASLAQSPQPPAGEAWRTSPYHGVIDGATGQPIPCRCRYRDREYRLGEAVCMNTHVGTVIARCDLHLNNTTWAPTTDACVISARPIQTLAR